MKQLEKCSTSGMNGLFRANKLLRKIEFIGKGRHEIFHLRHVICKSHALSSQQIILIISLTIHSFIYVRIQRITYLFTH